MADIKGDPTKQTADCPEHKDKCPNMKCVREMMDGERYRCEVCGESYYIDYDEMR